MSVVHRPHAQWTVRPAGLSVAGREQIVMRWVVAGPRRGHARPQRAG
ncbi:hypothetical protein [Dactylosporangium sp. CA-092794]